MVMSYAGPTRVSIALRNRLLRKKMDCRIKPGSDSRVIHLPEACSFRAVLSQNPISEIYLENPRRLGLDLFAYQRMQPLAGGEINLDMEALLKQSLGRYQVQGVKSPARVMIDENIDVAFGSGFIAGRRTEQIKRRRAQRLESARPLAQFPECFSLCHENSLA
jgi:hypothetical protein